MPQTKSEIAICYRVKYVAPALPYVQILNKQPLGLSLLRLCNPASSRISEMHAPHWTHVGTMQFGGGVRGRTCVPTYLFKL
jgi:hypothetical protein